MSLRVAHRRQFERHSVDVPAQLVIAAESQGQITFQGAAAVAARITDISGGGAHVITTTFVPRTAQVLLEIPPGAAGTAAGPTVPAGRIRCRVIAVQMLDAEPRYGLGLRFEDTDASAVQALRGAELEEPEA
ncbi:MAG: PilZ domain-containing protein [Planctomycetota bacterium]